MSQNYKKTSKEIIDENIQRIMTILFSQFISPNIFNEKRISFNNELKAINPPKLTHEKYLSQKLFHKPKLVENTLFYNHKKFNQIERNPKTYTSVNTTTSSTHMGNLNIPKIDIQACKKKIDDLKMKCNCSFYNTSHTNSVFNSREVSKNQRGNSNSSFAYPNKSCLFNDNTHLTPRNRMNLLNLQNSQNRGYLNHNEVTLTDRNYNKENHPYKTKNYQALTSKLKSKSIRFLMTDM